MAKLLRCAVEPQGRCCQNAGVPDPDTNHDLAALIRTIPDYPKPGILFRDISTLMLDGAAFRATIDRLATTVEDARFDMIAGIEARGFVFASALAYKLGLGTIMLRKRGKLPGTLVGVDYDLEYGTDRIEMHADACGAGHRVLLVDDLLATGGTAAAGVKLLRSNDATVEVALFVIDLFDLGGVAKLAAEGIECRALVGFPGH